MIRCTAVPNNVVIGCNMTAVSQPLKRKCFLCACHFLKLLIKGCTSTSFHWRLKYWHPARVWVWALPLRPTGSGAQLYSQQTRAHFWRSSKSSFVFVGVFSTCIIFKQTISQVVLCEVKQKPQFLYSEKETKYTCSGRMLEVFCVFYLYDLTSFNIKI